MDVVRGGMKLRKCWRFDVTPTTLDVQNIEGCNEVVGEGLFIPGCVGEASMDVARGGMKLRKCWMFDVTPTTLDVQNIEGCNEVVGEGLFIPGCVGGSIDHQWTLRAAA